MRRILVAYFSAGGTTRRAAEEIARAVDGDLWEIVPAQPYTAADLDWTDRKSRSTLEMNDPGCRPAMAASAPDLTGYDAVFIGFPIWWYVEPRIVDTFLEGCALSGKAVLPFATSGGSGIGRAEQRLRSLCPQAVWRPGRLVNSGAADWARSALGR